MNLSNENFRELLEYHLRKLSDNSDTEELEKIFKIILNHWNPINTIKLEVNGEIIKQFSGDELFEMSIKAEEEAEEIP